MTDASLSHDQAIALLRKLGSDDAFRSLFETKPAMALQQVGVSAEAIKALNPKCLAPSQLGDKSIYSDAASTMDKAVIADAMAMNTPNLNLGR